MSEEEELIVGRFQAHGAAAYQFQADQSPSYYVKVLTVSGERTLWGTDLKRAVEKSASKPKIGDVIGVRRTFREPVTFTERTRDSSGRVVSEIQRRSHRNRWIVEKAEFLAERAKLARRVRDEHVEARRATLERPELISTYLSLRGAEDIAARRIANPRDRERFLRLVREAIATSIENGKPLPAMRLREPAPAAERSSSTPPARREDDRTR